MAQVLICDNKNNHLAYGGGVKVIHQDSHSGIAVVHNAGTIVIRALKHSGERSVGMTFCDWRCAQDAIKAMVEAECAKP